MRVHTWAWLVKIFFFIDKSSTFTCTYFIWVRFFLFLLTDVILVTAWTWSNCWVIPCLLTRERKSSFSFLFIWIHTWPWFIHNISFINHLHPLASSNLICYWIACFQFVLIVIWTWTWSYSWIISGFLGSKCKSSFPFFIKRIHSWTWLIKCFFLINNSQSLGSANFMWNWITTSNFCLTMVIWAWSWS